MLFGSFQRLWFWITPISLWLVHISRYIPHFQHPHTHGWWYKLLWSSILEATLTQLPGSTCYDSHCTQQPLLAVATDFTFVWMWHKVKLWDGKSKTEPLDFFFSPSLKPLIIHFFIMMRGEMSNPSPALFNIDQSSLILPPSPLKAL